MTSQDLNGYETHFYCALCGGPFAQVYRTAMAPNPKRNNGRSFVEVEIDSDDLNPSNEFNIAAEDNVQIPEEVVLDNMGYAASRDRHRRITEAKSGMRRGIMSENRRTFKAYDGRLISVRQMRWTRNLRALIHKRAQHHPIEGESYLDNGNEAYLSGKGLIRQIEVWADAFASVELEDSELPLSDYQNNQYGFQVYQEIDRGDRNFVISSIPFHSSCWDILFVAIEVSAKERGVEDRWINEWLMGDEICDHIWGYLRGLIGVESTKMVGNMLNGERRGDLITRLGEVDYREAQGSGEGWQWRHDEGLHWIVADPEPEAIRFADSPLVLKCSNEEVSPSPGEYPHSIAVSHDPARILSLPPEIIMMMFEYLTSTDIFSFKLASPVFDVLKLPNWTYERFVKEEFKYFPALVNAVEEHNRRKKEARLEGLKFEEYVDWEKTFRRIRNSIRTPRDASEWDEIDISLKNRRRIWKIVKPMAEELVETTPIVLHYKYNATNHLSERISVVRGCLGTRSGKEGEYVSAYFAARSKANDRGLEIEEIDVYLAKVRVYLNAPDGVICGLYFYVFDDEDDEEQIRKFGRRTIYYEDVECEEDLIGFVFCFTDGVIGGVQFVHEKTGFSPRIGRWDGVVRKIVAPSEFRRMVGITGFINSSGFIEKIGLLEETFSRRVEDDYGRQAIPPTQVALSHEQSTVWNRLPPGNVRLVEREGLKVRNWRLHMAEWEVWARGYEEEGVNTKSHVKRLREIIGHFDEKFLRGLTFVYEVESTGGNTISVMGSSGDQYSSKIRLDHGENIAAVVLSTGVGGVHGVLFVTDRGRSSDFFGPRYLGSMHKVFGPISNANTTGDRMDIQDCDSIIGLHCLFDHEAKRFLQLGLILPENDDHFWEPQVACSIPFDEVDDNGLQWEGGPPPKAWDIGQKHGVLLSDCHTGSKFAGWVDLSLPMKKVVTYGRMNGIRFVFTNVPDKYFGNVYNDYDAEAQFIDGENGERIIGVFTISEEPEEEILADNDSEQDITVSSSSQHTSFMQRLWFLTNKNAHLRPLHTKPLFISELNSLRGLKFEFNAHRLQTCLPIYDPISKSKLEQRFPWSHGEVSADRQLSSSCSVAFEYFNNSSNRIVDAVKGYITSDGVFCGLLFRRNKEWDNRAFGGRSAFEVTVEIPKGETIAGAWISGATALSLVTNTGKCTPWFGRVTQKPEFRGPIESQMPVGVYGAIQRKQLHRVNWSILGLLYREVDNQQVIESPGIPLLMKCNEMDLQTGLPWLSDINNKRLDYELNPLASKRLSLYTNSIEEERVTKRFWRTYISFEPCEVEQIRVFVNRNPTLKGLRALRVIGTKKMGLTTMGEWPNAKNIVKRADKMKIQGPYGEKIVAIQVFFRCLEAEDKIVGLVVETSTGRKKELYSTDGRNEVDQRFGRLMAKKLECKAGHEIVGFHGIVSNLLMHNIGLVVRPISSGSSFALPNSNTTTVKTPLKDQSAECASSKISYHSGTEEETSCCTEATILSPENIDPNNSNNSNASISRYSASKQIGR